MADVIREEKYIKSDVNNNNNKWWTGQLLSDGTVVTKWGRVGDTGQSKTFPNAGAAFLDKKCREKESARNDEIPYRKLGVISGSGIVTSSSSSTKIPDSRVKEIAKKQIRMNNPIVEKLVEYLVKKNVHNIVTATEGRIQYNDATGLFSTPLGIITQESIDSANQILDSIANLITKQDYGSKMGDLTNTFCMTVPQNFGHKRLDVRDFWRDLSKVQYQKQIVDSLQASLITATKQTAKDDSSSVPEEKVFDCQLSLIEDGKVIDRIKKKVAETTHSGHMASRYKIQKIYGVVIGNMKSGFETKGKRVGGIMELFHGTKTCHLISIMKQGLIIVPASSGLITGSMFGRGAYFSSEASKSLNYSCGYWGGERDDRPYMFLADVAMGKFYVPSGPSSSLPKAGYDSTWAKPSVSGVANHEMIVYDIAQSNLTYLLEFA